MTAVDLDALDKLRGALAETIADHVFGLRDENGKPNYVARQAADALLPVVDRIANERAAAELRAAADEFPQDEHGNAWFVSQRIRARADALNPS